MTCVVASCPFRLNTGNKIRSTSLSLSTSRLEAAPLLWELPRVLFGEFPGEHVGGFLEGFLERLEKSLEGLGGLLGGFLEGPEGFLEGHPVRLPAGPLEGLVARPLARLLVRFHLPFYPWFHPPSYPQRRLLICRRFLVEFHQRSLGGHLVGLLVWLPWENSEGQDPCNQ